jgi:hypothetical protein
MGGVGDGRRRGWATPGMGGVGGWAASGMDGAGDGRRRGWAASGMGGVGDGRSLLSRIRDHPYMRHHPPSLQSGSGRQKLPTSENKDVSSRESSVLPVKRQPCTR